MSPEDSKNRAEHESLKPASPYSKAPQPSMGVGPHGPSLLRHASTSGLPVGAVSTPVSGASFAIVIGSSPPKGFASPAFARPSTTKKKVGRPFKNAHATSVKPITKKRGRPFKTPEAAAAAAAKSAKAASTGHLPQKRGRPFKYPEEPEHIYRIIPPEPTFVSFVCEWRNCPAELHNLDTLRAHLLTVHLKKQPRHGPLMCLWKGCEEHTVFDLETGQSSVLDKGVKFKTKEEWQSHVEKAHLDYVARWQGDGPKTEMSFFDKPRPAVAYTWLHGGPKGQPTPSVRDQPIQEGRTKDNNAARFVKKREGLYVVLEPVSNPEAYMKVDYDDDGDMVDMGNV